MSLGKRGMSWRQHLALKQSEFRKCRSEQRQVKRRLCQQGKERTTSCQGCSQMCLLHKECTVPDQWCLIRCQMSLQGRASTRRCSKRQQGCMCLSGRPVSSSPYRYSPRRSPPRMASKQSCPRSWQTFRASMVCMSRLWPRRCRRDMARPRKAVGSLHWQRSMASQ